MIDSQMQVATAVAVTPAALVEQAREMFFAQGRDPGEWLAPHIVRSWQRSRPLLHGSFPGPLQAALHDSAGSAPLAHDRLDERREQSMLLLECAQPELDGLAEHAIGNGCVVILTDSSGLILDEIGSPDFLPKAERIALKPGMEWSEGSRGTNAIGTALAEREALMVLGGEHYLPQNGALGCAAAPIFTGRGEVAGALDVSGETLRINQHALGMVRMAAQQVEHRMMLVEARGHVLRFHRRPGLLGTAREGLVVIDDGRIVSANRVALAMLQTSWDGLLDRHVEPLLGLRWCRLERQRGLLTLPGGQQIAAVMEPPIRGGSTHVRRAANAAAEGGDAAPAIMRDISVDPTHEPHEPMSTAPSSALLTTEGSTATHAASRSIDDDFAPLLRRAVRVLDDGVPVLVTGETGSGKEVFAHRLHHASRRRAGPFVAVNCAALPESLIEAELFGYVEGAFTGARRRGMPGRIREAHGGVLFLDEIADMPLLLQTRLLRVLEERVVHSLGGGAGTPVDFDLVCATHGDLPALAAAGRFRSDLMYRVAGFSVALPALRHRADRDDLIARLFDECGGAAKKLVLDESARRCLAEHGWPGNVRELRSVLRSVTALADEGGCIGVADLPAALRVDAGILSTDGSAAFDARREQPASASRQHPSGEPLQIMARHAIDHALVETGQDVAEAARRLGVHRSTVYRHLVRQRQQRD